VAVHARYHLPESRRQRYCFAFSFVVSVELLDDEADELGVLGDIELELDEELGGDIAPDDAVELGVDDDDVSVDEDALDDDGVDGDVVLDELLDDGGVDGDIVLDELLDDGGVVGTVVSLFCWQPTSAATTAAAAAVIMNRFIVAPFECRSFGRQRRNR
jgi:hypothetical protein